MNKNYLFLFTGFVLVSFSFIELTTGDRMSRVDSNIDTAPVAVHSHSNELRSITVDKKVNPGIDIEAQFKVKGLVDIKMLDSTIKVDLKYSTCQNFTGTDVYGALDKAYFQKEVAEKLASAQQLLKEKFPFYQLKILDAARPLSVQKILWDNLKLPFAEKINFLSNPNGRGSLHNYGAAVDITIVDDHNTEMDMGTAYDTFDPVLSHQSNRALLESGQLTYRQFDNRELLKYIMCKAGFFPIATEWWHFNACNLTTAGAKYELL